MFAEVVISVSHKDIDKPFYYIVPNELEHLIQRGMRVIVPFGMGNKKVEAYVINLVFEVNFPTDKLKSVISLLDTYPIFTDEMLNLIQWMQKKYYTTMADCLHTVMPAGIRVSKNSEMPTFKDYAVKVKYAMLNNETDESGELDTLIDEVLAVPSKQCDVLQLVISSGMISVNDIKSYLNISDSPIKSLVKKGVLAIETYEVKRDIFDAKKIEEKSNSVSLPILTEEQENAINKINSLIDSGERSILIHGVTGSGKTEIYMRLIEDVINEGKQAIVLVPEISLTPQAVETFMSRFSDNVTVTHSRLSLGERFDQWKKAREGLVSVMIGPRSAIFTPFSNLGIIIIDEEHEKTYKSETTPKYDARQVAKKRSELTDCCVILGSATPSISTYFETTETTDKDSPDRIALVELKEKVNKKATEIIVVDMRLELATGNNSIFSNVLYKAIKDNLENKMQSILFLNRRGHSTFVSCRRCGHVLACNQCSVNYTYHSYDNSVMCHYCGKRERTPDNCPVCGSKHIRYFGVGTQKVEDEVKKLFPNASVLRMDMDTTTRKNSHEKIIYEFAEGNTDILIGTQMIAKGHNFPNVSLVGIIAADISLNTGDFSSAETAYQLITQVSGRAGRAETSGTIYIQTYTPEHYSIQFAKETNYNKFYDHEIAIRRQMRYPPFSHIFVVLFSGINEKKIIQSLSKLLEIMKYYNRKNKFDMLGPAPAVISKIKKNYRWRLLIRGEDEELLKLFVFYCIDKLDKKNDLFGINVNLTLDPSVIQ